MGTSYFSGHRTREHVWIPDLAISAEEEIGPALLATFTKGVGHSEGGSAFSPYLLPAAKASMAGATPDTLRGLCLMLSGG